MIKRDSVDGCPQRWYSFSKPRKVILKMKKIICQDQAAAEEAAPKENWVAQRYKYSPNGNWVLVF